MGHSGGSESAFCGSALDASGQNSGFSKGVLQNRAGGAHARNSDLGSGGVCAHTASATGERVGRGGSQALFPTSYLDPTPPKQLHPGLNNACFSILL